MDDALMSMATSSADDHDVDVRFCSANEDSIYAGPQNRSMLQLCVRGSGILHVGLGS